ncbi:MAG: HAD-IB family phosphatase, partial [Caulobacterales bacterium]|nr:HAD-IB family phosphatase [Caulobacterales bacterium]
MPLIASLVGSSSDVRAALGELLPAAPHRWLAGGPEEASPRAAVDAAVRGDPDALRAALAERPIDWCLHPAENRKKRLLLADMDSTIIGCECVDELADVVGVGERVAAITERAMQGELDFVAALAERVALLEGLNEERLAEVYAERVRINPGARALTATMRAHGGRCVLVSGGFTQFASRVAADAGFDHFQANELEMAGDRLTG